MPAISSSAKKTRQSRRVPRPAQSTTNTPNASKGAKPLQVEIVIPVYNEAHTLPEAIAKSHAYIANTLPYRCQITIIDNGSTDDTWKVAKQLARQYEQVAAKHLDYKGRGLALRHAWGKSKAKVVAYMDFDLSTDLAFIEPLVRPLLEQEADISIGSRLMKGSDVNRGLKREFISRAYNSILHATLGLKVKDAQCGFKAMRTDTVKRLLPEVSDNAWFFDTELLAKAQQHGLRIYELPVKWRDDPDSRVNIVRTAIDDLKGIRRLRRERDTRSKREKWALAGILLGTFLLYGFGALHNGFGNSFYAAAVEAGTHSWKAFFFGSLDAANYITVDKPPVSLWPMEISTRIFGFHAWSMMLPNVLAGVGTIALVYAAVRRWFSARSALVAALVTALTPIAVVMFGFNNPDAILTLLLTASIYTTIRALDSDRPIHWLALTGVLTGFAFNTKMLQGLIAIPVLALVYLYAAKYRPWVRIKHLLIAGVFLMISALWWPAVVSLVPASSRPYIGGSTNNSVWDLIIGYNGLGRFLGNSSGAGAGGGPGGRQGMAAFNNNGNPGMGAPSAATGGAPMSFPGGGFPGGSPPANGGNGNGFPGFGQNNAQLGGLGGGPGGAGFGGSTGVLRIFNTSFGANIAWLVPLSFIAVAGTIWARWKRPRTDRKRVAFLLWGGYLGLHIAVFSMTGGIIHPYYTVVIAPAVGALTGIGLLFLIREFRNRTARAFLLPLAIVATGIVAFVLLGYETSWLRTLRVIILPVSIGIAGLLSLYLIKPVKSLGNITRALLASACAVCIVAPTVYAFDSVTVAHTGSIPTAGSAGTAMPGSNNESSKAESSFVNYLLAHKGTAKWVVAVSNANESSPIQLSTGQPVMAVGGFMGSDPAMTTERLSQLVASGQLKYYAVSKGGAGGFGGGRGGAGFRGFGGNLPNGLELPSGAEAFSEGGGFGMGNTEILNWVKSHSTEVKYGGSAYTLYEMKV